LLTRYQNSEHGRTKLADIYTNDEHGITRNKIGSEALSVTHRISRSGRKAYIVGGAVRDLLVGKAPKDFDIATDALPSEVRRLFRRSRIIGKRFQLVHVYVHDKILEVSTFRATPEGEVGRDSTNIFGTLAEDVRRRDFTMNSLYYDPTKEHIVDFIGGFDDIKMRRLKLLKPAEESFSEDPVRMIRALRYSSTTGFPVPQKIGRAVRRLSSLLSETPDSRLTEELFKILGCGASTQFFAYAREFELLGTLMPTLEERLNDRLEKSLLSRLSEIDRMVVARGLDDKSMMIEALCEPFIDDAPLVDLDPDMYGKELFRECKRIVAPLTPPNAIVDKAVRAIMNARGISGPKKRRRKRKGIGR